MQVKQTFATEHYIIYHIRDKRKEKGISQRELENRCDFAGGFIGKVESPNSRAKYNINHVVKICEVIGCSLWDIIPEWPPKHKTKI